MAKFGFNATDLVREIYSTTINVIDYSLTAVSIMMLWLPSCRPNYWIPAYLVPGENDICKAPFRRPGYKSNLQSN